MPAVSFENVYKIYPDGNIALRGVSFQVEKGEIHGLLGENGAGKTTLMRILYGEIKPSSGAIRVFGEKVKFDGPWDAIQLGIGMVYQKFSLIGGFTVLENLSLSALPLGLERKDVLSRVERIVEEIGMEIPLQERVDLLPVGVRQRVEIVKALVRDAKILILDEPTSVLTPLEVKELFRVLRKLKERGLTIIFITHKLREVKAITDRVTVLRKGKVAGTSTTSDVSELELARMMVGREVLFKLERRKAEPREEALVVKGLWVRADNGLWAVKGVNLRLRYGEILGIAGVQGNGQKELIEAIVGIRKPEKGSIKLKGRDLIGLDPSQIYKMGLAYIPDLRSTGLVMGMDLVSNFLLTRIDEFTTKSVVSWRRAISETRNIIDRFNVITDDIRKPIERLSGGNQQKFLLAREISRGPDIIVASEPTHGLDVGATEYIRKHLIDLRDSGKAVLLVSTDLDEIMQLSDRVAVMYEGKVVAEGPTESFTLDRLGLLMGGIVGG